MHSNQGTIGSIILSFFIVLSIGSWSGVGKKSVDRCTVTGMWTGTMTRWSICDDTAIVSLLSHCYLTIISLLFYHHWHQFAIAFWFRYRFIISLSLHNFAIAPWHCSLIPNIIISLSDTCISCSHIQCNKYYHQSIHSHHPDPRSWDTWEPDPTACWLISFLNHPLCTSHIFFFIASMRYCVDTGIYNCLINCFWNNIDIGPCDIQ